jgi:hypothetical protein
MTKASGLFTGIFRNTLNYWQSRRVHHDFRTIAVLTLAIASFSATTFKTAALTITSGPIFTPASNAPLAGVLQLGTDVPTRVSLSVWDGTNTWQRNFLDYTNVHTMTVLGFKPGRTNAMTVTVWDKHRRYFTAVAPVQFVTSNLPSNFPVIDVLTCDTNRMEPGYTLFRGANNNGGVGYVTFVDNTGQVVWYSSKLPTYLNVLRRDDGNLFMGSTTYANFVEVNMLGQTISNWPVAVGYSLNYHDSIPTDHGTILYINDSGKVITNYPTSSTNPSAPKQTTNVMYNRIIEMSIVNSALSNNWPLIDMLDPLRIDYLTFTIRSGLGWDSEHANGVIEDPSDNSLIVSMRHQDAVIKFTRSGQLKWILGPHENWKTNFQKYLLTPVGTPFAWNYAQHNPQLTPQGTLLAFDDGNYRASPFAASTPDSANYSRAVEYQINEQTMEVSQIWEYGGSITQKLFTPSVGGVEWLEKSGNVLVTFGNITYAGGVHPSAYSTNAAMVRIKEVTHDDPAEVVFDMALWDYTNTAPSYTGCFTYRSQRVPDLYAHPALPVSDLFLQLDTNGAPHLQFSGDEARTYTVESSSDISDWEAIGTATPTGSGNFDFIDEAPAGTGARYYRVATQ